MELVAQVLLAVACAGVAVAVLLWRTFMPAYVAEKAKNLASKEDLAHLTRVVEEVKAAHTEELERIKATLATEANVMERRRKVYEEIGDALRVFVEGHGSTDQAKNRFHAAYAAAWLWASDDAVNQLNRFIALQSQHSANPRSVPMAQLKAAYVEVVLAMRRDVGFPETAVPASSYQFVQFS